METITENYMVFRSGDYSFGIPEGIVQKILAEYLMEKIPWISTWACGILYYEEQIIPVVRFGSQEQQMAVICRYGENLVAYLASEVGESITISENELLEEKSGSNNRARVYGDIHIYSDALWSES